ncbi:MAG: hypothetical protein AAGD04_14030 [Pseudomonadota bacterium]
MENNQKKAFADNLPLYEEPKLSVLSVEKTETGDLGPGEDPTFFFNSPLVTS